MAERRALVRNAGDPKQVRRAKESETERRKRELAELKDTAAYPAGWRVLWRVLEKCGMQALSFRADPYQTAFNEGARNVGLYLLAELFQADPDAYSRMQKDAARQNENITEPMPRTDDPMTEDDDGN